MAKRFTEADDELLAELGVEIETGKAAAHTQEEERVMAGFEDIRKFTDTHGRPPAHGEDRDIFERLYAVRLDRLRGRTEYRELLAPLDRHGLLDSPEAAPEAPQDGLDDDALLAELGVETDAGSDITELTHVRSGAEKRAAEEIANRVPCREFDRYKPRFDMVQKDLDAGVRITQQIRKDAGFLKADVRAGHFFILGGQTIYVAEIGEPIRAPNGEFDARLRVIYANGTESNLLLRSLQRALYKDETSRCISDPGEAGPLFSSESGENDLATGTIYVLRSESDLPDIVASRDVIHKIGVTGGAVEKRIANAKLDPTFLMADVEVVATYKLYNIDRISLENLIHRIFAPGCLNIEIKDRFGNPVAPREWFLVPLATIDDAVEKIRDGTITDYTYDAGKAELVKCV